jgi:hypothetical protein
MRRRENTTETDFREQGLGVWTGSSGSGYGPVAGSYEHGNEPSSSIKGGEFLYYLSVLLASQTGLCSLQLVQPFEDEARLNFI